MTIMMLSATYLKAQDARVVFPEIQMTIDDAFKEIEKQTDFLISVNHSNFDVSRKVKFTRNNLSVKDAMEQILRRAGRRFTVRGHHIVISAPDESIVIPEVPEAEPEEPVIEALPEIDLTIPPLDVDSLERELRARKIEFPTEIPPEPLLDKTIYYNVRDNKMKLTGTPAYVASIPKVALRTNLLYGIGTLTPNLGIEMGFSPRSSFLLSGSYNPWDLDNKEADKMLCHWQASLEYRHWFCERFNGHFIGVHGYYGNYHVKGYKIPLLLEKGSEDYRFKGNVYGAGISWGYHWMLSPSWNIEFNAGVGFGITKYDKFDCDRCSDKLEKGISRTFIAPTKLGISLVYIIK